MQLVILAAGHGRRFGGLKQLAPVGPDGEAIMDYTASAAFACGYSQVVLVVREEIRQEILDHVRKRWPSGLPVEAVCQPPIPGTAQAVLCANGAIDEPFGVANADDLYGDEPLAMIKHHFDQDSSEQRHVLVGYELANTVLSPAPVTRGLCSCDEHGRLKAIIEHVVERRPDHSFEGRALSDPKGPKHPVAGADLVSMNFWGFHQRIFEHLEAAVSHFVPPRTGRKELILPDVLNEVVSSGRDQVQVIATAERCIGVTHQEDAAIVRKELAARNNTGASGHSPT